MHRNELAKRVISLQRMVFKLKKKSLLFQIDLMKGINNFISGANPEKEPRKVKGNTTSIFETFIIFIKCVILCISLTKYN